MRGPRAFEELLAVQGVLSTHNGWLHHGRAAAVAGVTTQAHLSGLDMQVWVALAVAAAAAASATELLLLLLHSICWIEARRLG
jgi:hypothetical protein